MQPQRVQSVTERLSPDSESLIRPKPRGSREQQRAHTKASKTNLNKDHHNTIDKPNTWTYSRSYSLLQAKDAVQSSQANQKSRGSQSLKKYPLVRSRTKTVSSVSGPLRSKLLSVHATSRPYEDAVGEPKIVPYQNFVRELKIRLPSPCEKFLEFIRIPPFNRLKNHIDFISHMLKQEYEFFRIHPTQVVEGIARKIIQVSPEDVPGNYLVICIGGECYYGSKQVQTGDLVCRNKFDKEIFSYDAGLSLIGLPNHEYEMFISNYLNQNKDMFRKFLTSVQIFKIFPEAALDKMFSNLSLHFYMRGEVLYQPQDAAEDLLVIHSGSAARKIIVQIEKTNKIPIQKYSKLVKVTSRSYENRIKFEAQDLVGVADIIDGIHARSETIVIDNNSTIVAIDRNAIQQNLDEYIIDRLRKYNLRKYPRNYDQLCENYLREKLENRKAEERKIAALRDEINRDVNNCKKMEKISSIIKLYQNRIKEQEAQHLIHRNKVERLIHNET